MKSYQGRRNEWVSLDYAKRVYKAARKSPYDEEVAQIMDEQKKPYHYRKRKSGRTSQGKIYADH